MVDFVIDGRPIPQKTVDIINIQNPELPIHLRVIVFERFPKLLCQLENDQFVPDWWTGDVKQVTCTDCLELIHS